MIGNFSQIFSRFHCVNKSNWCFSGVPDECQSLLHFLKPDQFAAVYGCTDPPPSKKKWLYTLLNLTQFGARRCLKSDYIFNLLQLSTFTFKHLDSGYAGTSLVTDICLLSHLPTLCRL